MLEKYFPQLIEKGLIPEKIDESIYHINKEYSPRNIALAFTLVVSGDGKVVLFNLYDQSEYRTMRNLAKQIFEQEKIRVKGSTHYQEGAGSIIFDTADPDVNIFSTDKPSKNL